MNIIELLDAVRDRYRARIALAEFTEDGLRTMPYDERARQRSRLSAFLTDHRIEQGDRVAILSTHTVPTADGVRVSVDLYGHGDHGSVVIICPGYFQSKDTATFQRLARALTSSHDVMCLDFRGHGRSSGLYTFSAREGADLDAVLDAATARYRRIGVLGFSLGAAIALNTVSRCQDHVQSLIAVSAPMAFEEIEFKFWTPEAIRTGVVGLERGAGGRPGNLFLKKDRPIDSIQKLSGVPVLLIHGTNDPIVSLQHSQRLYEAAPEPKRLEIIERGGHAEELYRREPERFLAIVQPWLEATLSDP